MTLSHLTKRFCKATLAIESVWNSLLATYGQPVFSNSKYYLSWSRLNSTHFSRGGGAPQKECWAGGEANIWRLSRMSWLSTMLPESINTKVLVTRGRNSNIFASYLLGPLNLQYFVPLHIASFLLRGAGS